MTTTTLTPAADLMDPVVAARFMNRYARSYSAGAFATPTAAEVAGMMSASGRGRWLAWDGGCAAVKTLGKASKRKDFTGREYVLAPGDIITHIAVEPGSHLPNLTWASTVYAYAEDTGLVAGLVAQGREVRAVKVSAAAEIITAYGRPGTGAHYPPCDTATIRRIPIDVSPSLQERIHAEAKGLTGWLDDFPFYSDGSWSALNLRGFKPDDPSWGIKPSEMSKSWWAENPEAKSLTTCDWTVLADRCPATRALVESVSWWGRLERVRFLRMAGRPGKKGGLLSRHSDVTDRAAGTRDGAIARFHMPIITHPAIKMTAWNLAGRAEAVHLPAWTLWYLDARKPHSVRNPTQDVDRIHLVVDVIADQDVRDRISAGAEHVH